MAILVELAVPSAAGPDSTPRRVFEEVPDIELEVESFVPVGTAAIPYFWAWGESVDDLERALVADPGVDAVDCIERVDGGALFSVEWEIDDPLVECLAQTDGAIMDAYGTASEWTLTIWFEHREDASAFQRCCVDRNLSFEVIRVRSVADLAEGSKPVITPAQREALLVAYERGYFEQPRGATQAELADELGVSAAAFGNRIRRGMANLVDDALIRGTESDFARGSVPDFVRGTEPDVVRSASADFPMELPL